MYHLFQSLIISPLFAGAEGGHSWKASVPGEKGALSHVTLLDGNAPMATSRALPRPMCLSMSTIVSTPTSLHSTCLGDSSVLSPHFRQVGHSRLYAMGADSGLLGLNDDHSFKENECKVASTKLN